MSACATKAATNNLFPKVGAIRWDAWTGGKVTAEVEKSLGPRKYHDRLPWFAEVIGENKVSIKGGSQEIMDREIDFAAGAGLDYWAFLLYPESSPMSKAIRLYLSSKKRGQINFCLILHNSFGVSEAAWPGERDRAVALLKEPGYQAVLNGRPLVFEFEARYRGERALERIAEFRAAAQKAGLNPYLVFMGWDPANDFPRQSTNGFDAVSAYAQPGSQPTYAELARSLENDCWQNAAGAGAPYVPLVTAGWEKNPRKDNPVSWELGQDYHLQEVFPSVASPQEIAAHLERAVKFVGEHPKICTANAVIIYAWNEYDEGGWIAPTRGAGGKPDTGRLDAIGRILKRDAKAIQPSAADTPPQAARR
ncbi:MAG: hypothetical protein WC299_06975 [Kiritimatiellia bacterium]